jgi:hypothetical protein
MEEIFALFVPKGGKKKFPISFSRKKHLSGSKM